MGTAEPSWRLASLAGRAAEILFRPAKTWRIVAAEPAEARALFLGYVAPLAAIGPVCGVVGLQVFGASIAGIHLKPGLGAMVVAAGLDYALGLVAVYLLALAVSALAPAFGGEASCSHALALVAYSGTPFWISGLFALYPTLGFPVAVLGGLYSFYVLYLGLGPMMRAAPERSLSYFAAVLACALALGVLLRLAAERVA
jgi:Yip1 domain